MISKMPKTVEAIPPLTDWCCHSAVRLLASASSLIVTENSAETDFR